MARIQRKKGSGAKKKKKPQVGSGTSKPGEKDIATPSSDAVKSSKNQRTQTAKNPISIARPAPIKPKDNFVARGIQFLREVKMELKKVTWPSRKQTLGSTVVVIILVSIIAFFLGAVDIGLSALMRMILQ